MKNAAVRTTPCARARIAAAASLATWPAAALLLLLYSHRAGITSPRAFAVAWTWLVALGCLGAPVYGLRAAGRRLSATGARHIGLLFTGVTLATTALFATGQLHPRIGVLYASLILPMAIAVAALNGAEVLRREQHAYERGRRDALAGQLEGRAALAETLLRFDDATLEELEREHEALRLIVEAKRRGRAHTGAGDLHAVPEPGARQRN